MADRIVVMHDGNVEQIGAPLELYDHPENLFVAGFIGSPAMNFIPGKLSRRNGAASLIADNGTEIVLGPEVAGADGQSVIFGVRPEHLELATDIEGVDTEVIVVEPTGSETLVVATMAGTQVQAAFRERHDFRAGKHVYLRPRLDHVHVFDAETHRRITH